MNDIKVLKIDDQEDGSAIVEFECSQKTYETIFNYGFVKLLERAASEEKERRVPDVLETDIS
jgi:hypothetical protein